MQPLAFSAPLGPCKPPAAGWTSRLTGYSWCVGSQAAVLPCCITNIWTEIATGQLMGQGPVEQVSCRAYCIWQACTVGLPAKSVYVHVLVVCSWESAGLFPFYKSIWGCRVPDTIGPSSMTRSPGHSSYYASTTYFVQKLLALNMIYMNMIYRSTLIMCVWFLSKL